MIKDLTVVIAKDTNKSKVKDIKYAVMLVIKFEPKPIFALLRANKALPILHTIKNGKFFLTSRTKKCVVLEAEKEGTLDIKIQEVTNAVGFKIFKDNKVTAWLIDPCFMYALPQLMRGAAVMSGLDPELRHHWNKDGSFAVKAQHIKPVLMVDGKIVELAGLCEKCPMRLHAAVGSCRLLDDECLISCNSIFYGKLYNNDSRIQLTCHDKQIWCRGNLKWSGLLDTSWFKRHKMRKEVVDVLGQATEKEPGKQQAKKV